MPKKTYQSERRERWTDEEIMQLLMTGKADNHSRASCKSTLSKLRNDDVVRNRFREVIHRYESETGNELKPTVSEPVHYARWTDEDALQLLMTGKADNHSTVAAKYMLGLLRNDAETRNKFSAVIRRYEYETGKKLKPCRHRRAYLTPDQIEKIKNHIVPIGLDKAFCAVWIYNHGFSSGKWTPWTYEAECGRRKQEPVETVKEVEQVTGSELELNLQAVRALSNSGMTSKQIAAVIGKDENIVTALMKVCEAF